MKKRNILLGLCLSLLSMSTWAQITPAPRPYVEYLPVTDHGDRIYALGEQASVRLYANVSGRALDGVKVSVTCGPEMQSPDYADSLCFHNGVVELPVGTAHKPGFRTCRFSFRVEGKEYKDMVKVAFAPEQIRPVIPCPEDFTDFWQQTLETADKNIPMEPVVTRLPHRDTDFAEVSLVKINCGENGRCIYGYLIKPKAEGKYPVILYPPGAGSKRIVPEYDYAREGFISLKIEIHGLSPELPEEEYKQGQKAVEKYMYRGLDAPEDYYYKDVYVGCARAIDFLCSLPEFDGRNVGVSGGSQGGALTIVTAALNKKVTFLAPFYPALSDMNGFLEGRAGGWPKFFSTDRQLPATPDVAVRTLSYYDVVNFAHQLTVPGFYSYGYNDETCSPTSVTAVVNSVKAPKEVVITPVSGHWRFAETNRASIEWMKTRTART